MKWHSITSFILMFDDNSTGGKFYVRQPDKTAIIAQLLTDDLPQSHHQSYTPVGRHNLDRYMAANKVQSLQMVNLVLEKFYIQCNPPGHNVVSSTSRTFYQSKLI